jgi:DNA-binding NtrC family response regulator
MEKKKDTKVLLVDDEVDFVDTLAQRLKMRELLVDTVYDGEQALSFIDKVEPDVMVLDLRMPGLHGMEVLREINKLKRDIPVIILTGHGTEKDEEEARRLGASDFLRKPANIDLLVVSINRCNYA